MSSPKTVIGIVGLGALIAMLAPVFSYAQALTPSISNVAATSTADGTGANITWMTDIPSDSQVEYGTTTSYGTFSAILDSNAPVTSHAVTLSALQPNTLYHFAVLSMASSSSATSSSSFAAASADHTFVTLSATGTASTSTATSSGSTSTSTTGTGTTTVTGTSTSSTTGNTATSSATSTPSTTGTTTSTSTSNTGTTTATSTATTTTPITVSNIAVNPSTTTATVTWNTDQPAGTQVRYGTTTNYSASTTPDNTQVTSHSAPLFDLTPNLLYHFQVVSGNGSTTATSSDQTFMTLASTTGTTTPPTGTTTPPTATSTPPVISGITATPTDTTATITWTTDQPSSSQVAFGTSAGNLTSSTTPDTTAVTSHSATLSGLTASTTYHFRVTSGTSATTSTSADQSFMTLASGTSTGTSTSTSTATSTPTATSTSSSTPTTSGGLTMNDLFNLIQQLQGRVSTLESQVQALFARSGGTGTSTPPSTSGSAFVDQNGQTAKAGGSIDFGGHNFGSEEHVNVMLNGQQIATGFTNTGGGFSTGSLSLPSTPGTYTYTFVGQVSGKTALATLTVQ